MDIINKIEKLMNNNQMKQADLARALGIRSSSVSDWFNKKSTSYTKYLSELAKVFNVSVDYLLGTEGEEKEKSTISAKNETEKNLLLLCRQVEDASEEDKARLVKQFEATIDIYLSAKNIKRKED